MTTFQKPFIPVGGLPRRCTISDPAPATPMPSLQVDYWCHCWQGCKIQFPPQLGKIKELYICIAQLHVISTSSVEDYTL